MDSPKEDQKICTCANMRCESRTFSTAAKQAVKRAKTSRVSPSDDDVIIDVQQHAKPAYALIDARSLNALIKSLHDQNKRMNHMSCWPKCAIDILAIVIVMCVVGIAFYDFARNVLHF